MSETSTPKGLGRAFGIDPHTLVPYAVVGGVLALADALVLGAGLERFAALAASSNTDAFGATSARALPELAALLGAHAVLGLALGSVSIVATQIALGQVRLLLYDRIRLAFPSSKRDDDIASVASTLAYEVNMLRPFIDALVVGVVRHVLALGALAWVAFHRGGMAMIPVVSAFGIVALVTLVISRVTRRWSVRAYAAGASHASRLLERLRVRDVDWVHRRGLATRTDRDVARPVPPSLRELADSELRVGLVSASSRPAIEAVLAATLTFVWLATRPFSASDAASIAALVLAVRPISAIFSSLQALPLAMAAADRLDEAARDLAPVPRQAVVVPDDAPLVLDALTDGYGDRNVVTDLSGTIHRGETLLVRGPNGSGKSTLLGCLAGARRPLGGAVRLGSVHLDAAVQPDGSSAIGFVPQIIELERGSLVEATGVTDATTLADAAKRAGFGDLLETLAKAPDVPVVLGAAGQGLSSGQRTKLAIARALAHTPVLLVLDEPTASLDAASSTALLAALRRHADAGNIVVIASHDAEGSTIADVVLELGREVPAFVRVRAGAER